VQDGGSNWRPPSEASIQRVTLLVKGVVGKNLVCMWGLVCLGLGSGWREKEFL